ncbi:hypothetical protein A1O3_02143 [Capronia epimyces CBS 606.96]|uniref:Atos-like conserved domain-containing protein n=1 Tax=Capronia epimyces CBS 606.96 TaxID=1182542 RepID=W9Z3K1_9EURO|nr:uncharacterized protein A1O3_02143 [Capronia epimyces CBS 606.96]EXJ89079.1 hypothetical protein A1O3_02143 [Capronia epimyces CBS 606.96]
MPFVIDPEGLPTRSAKRQKLLSHPDMARYSVQTLNGAGNSPSEREGDAKTPTEGQKEVDSDTGETPIETSDREELIQCIKRGQRPTWVPRPGLEALCAEVNTEQDRPYQPDKPVRSASVQDAPPQQGGTPSTAEANVWYTTDALRRSLSALHTGDFHDHVEHVPIRPSSIRTPPRRSLQSAYSISPPSWLSESPTLGHDPTVTNPASDTLKRTRAPSLGSSFSSQFVMRVPTSPLVHAINNPSLDFSPRDAQPHDTSMPNVARRRTMHTAFEPLHMSPVDDTRAKFNGVSPPSHQDANALPQGHRTRRSLSSFTYQPAASPQAALSAKLRRPSLASDASPRQRASMVGSFEESILRGRMSTPPSKPLDFVAQIGVVGKGNCPATLKCPAHVTVPFPAVFYNYPSATSSRSISDDNPSPYVGVIDLERNLTPPEPSSRRTRRSQSSLDPEALAAAITSPENTAIGRALAREARENKDKASPSLKVPPGGAYRVPQKGQLQIIIKNPNKTAVKLFLVPYDLEGMSPGTKTFVRQRSFSSGPILEATLAQQQADLAALDPLSNKDILRYLIHIKFCSTAKGRFYLYDNIRVVFANRVPDGNEKLRNEVQLPDPRFSPYKPPVDGGSRSPSLAEGACSPQTRSGRFPGFGSFDNSPESGFGQRSSTRAQDPASIPFHISPRPIEQDLSGPHHAMRMDGARLVDVQGDVSPISGFLPSSSSRSSPLPWLQSGRNSMVRGFSAEAGDGLISRKLKELNGGGTEQNI